MPLLSKQSLRKVFAPLARLLASLGVSPNFLTLLGLGAAAGSAAAVASGSNGWGLALLLASAFADILDGDVARLTPQRSTRFGAFFDSTLDRVSDALLLGGLLLGKLLRGGGLTWPWAVIWLLTLTGSFLVSYARARAEGLGIECRVGIADRTLRMVLIALMLILGYRWMLWLLALTALLSWVTVGQRLYHVWRAMRAETGSRVAPAAAPPPGGRGAA